MGPAAGRRGPLVFLGTSDFAVPSMEALVAAGEDVALVVCQPDRPKGRGRRLEPPAAKTAALRLDLPVYQPESINDPEGAAKLRALAPELTVVVAYGQILKRPILEAASRGAVNLHPSLLPRHRGPSPIAWAILSGDQEIGSSTMLLDEGLDSGPVLLQESFPLPEEATRGDLEAKLSRTGAALLTRTVGELRDGTLEPRPQDPAEATHTGLLTPEMGRIDWTRPAREVRRLIHALSPRPGATARIREKRVRILRAREAPMHGIPGRVLEVTESGPVVGCGSGALVLSEVHPEGRRPMSGADLARGGGIGTGDALEAPPGPERRARG